MITKTIIFDPKFRQNHLVVEMKPVKYIGSRFIHPDPDYKDNRYIYGSYQRNRTNLNKSKKRYLRHISLKLENKHIKISDFRFTYWKQLSKNGDCCFYYGLIEDIDNKVKDMTLEMIRILENFDEWKFTD